MATNEINSVIVELYDLAITSQKDDRFGRVVTSKVIKDDDLVNIAAARRTDLNPNTLRMAMALLTDVALEYIVNGNIVYFGPGIYSLGVNGVFYGDNATWDSKKHELFVKATPRVNLRERLKTTKVEIRGMASVGTAINTVTDVASGEQNGKLTPGGAVNLRGNKIRIAGDSTENGVRLVNEETSSVVVIPTNMIATNEPSKITFILPADLPAGDYKLTLTTQFSTTAQLLKEPRTYTFDFILTV